MNAKDKLYDVAVVGAGASGLMSAGLLGQAGLSVILIEKNAKVGEKLSITGGGRCNITNAEFDNKKLLENYGDAKKFLYSPFSKFSSKDTFEFFESLGLPIVVEARKRAFPKSQSAKDVVLSLEKFIKLNSVDLKLKARVKSIKKIEEASAEFFELDLGKGQSLFAKNVVFAVGGPSGKTLSKEIPASWRILEKLGHSIKAPSPDLVPLKTRAKFVHKLSGLSMSFVALRFKLNGKTQFKKLGKILFTHFGVSGPTVINSSKEALTILKNHGRLTLSIDFFPDTEFDKLDRRIIALMEKHKRKKLRNTLTEILPEELVKALIYITDKSLRELNSSEVTREQRRALVKNMKDMSFNITGPMGLDWAIVADGGVELKEVDFKSMESRIVKGLYLTGDVLNINRPSGGFSLQLCWTTAYVAVSAIIEKMKKL